MEQITYDIETLENRIKELQEQIKVPQALVECGISRKATKYWATFYFSSGFVMGEIVEYYCGGKLIQRSDLCEEYVRSCKYKALHGYIRIDFNKKQLKEYISHNRKAADARLHRVADWVFVECEESDAARALAKSCINKEASLIKKGTKI